MKKSVYATEMWDTDTLLSCAGMYNVAKHIGEKTDCVVVLVGEGADEVCSSYDFNWFAPNGEELHAVAKQYV